VRAGFGIFNDLLDNLGIRAYPNPPYSAREQLQIPASGFLSLLPLQKNATLPPTCGPGIASPCSIYQPAGFDPNMFTPTVQEWSFTVERQLAKDLMLQVGYVGSQAYHTNLVEDTNSARPQICQNPQGCDSGGILSATQVGCKTSTWCVQVPQGTLYMPSVPPRTVNAL
jgi:hypothetical protein